MRPYNTSTDFYTHNNNYRPPSPMQTSYNNNYMQNEKYLNANTYTGLQYHHPNQNGHQEQVKKMNSTSNGYGNDAYYVNQAAMTTTAQSYQQFNNHGVKPSSPYPYAQKNYQNKFYQQHQKKYMNNQSGLSIGSNSNNSSTTRQNQTPPNSNQNQNQNISSASYSINKNKQSVNISTANFTPTTFPQTSKVMNLTKFVQENIKLRKNLLEQLDRIKESRAKRQSQVIRGNKMIGKQKQQDLSYQGKMTKMTTRDVTPTRYQKERVGSNGNSGQHAKKNSFNERQRTQHPSPQPQNNNKQLLTLIEKKHLQLQQNQTYLHTLKTSNTQKTLQLHNLHQNLMNTSIHQTPLLKQKQQHIEYLSIQIQWLNQKNQKLKKVTTKKMANNDSSTNFFQLYEQMCRQCQSKRKENNKKSQKLKKLFQKLNKLTGKEENVNMFLMNLKI